MPNVMATRKKKRTVAEGEVSVTSRASDSGFAALMVDSVAVAPPPKKWTLLLAGQPHA
jgi:hypothetical protein